MVLCGFLNSKKSVFVKAPSMIFYAWHLIRCTNVLLRQSAEILCCPILFCIAVHQIRPTCFSFCHKLFLGICGFVQVLHSVLNMKEKAKHQRIWLRSRWRKHVREDFTQKEGITRREVDEELGEAEIDGEAWLQDDTNKSGIVGGWRRLHKICCMYWLIFTAFIKKYVAVFYNRTARDIFNLWGIQTLK